jgi:hypothetical protein
VTHSSRRNVRHKKGDLAELLTRLDLGSSIAESDNLLEIARVETSVFTDLLADRVDLIPGTKGSGKSALYRIFVDFMPRYLAEQRKIVVAHGVQSHGDSVFHAFRERFDQLSEPDFVDFWCIYLISLAHEHFIKNPDYAHLLADSTKEVEAFKRACYVARRPEIRAKKTLKEVLEWALDALASRFKPKLSINAQTQETSLTLFDYLPQPAPEPTVVNLPNFVSSIRQALDAVLVKADLHLWLMVDRLDEVFPRRSATETKALRGLLRTLAILSSPRIRVKIFLRDDILAQISEGPEGFTGLTHITARQANRLKWSEDQILTLVVKRLSASDELREYLAIDLDRLNANRRYQEQVFYQVFPQTVHSGPNQSSTLGWIYTHTQDGRNVVTPRDVIDLLTRAKQQQQDEFRADPTGDAEWIIGPAAIRYGHSELSTRKKDTYLRAEFPHFWPHIEKFIKGKTEYSESAIKRLLGRQSEAIVDDLLSIGLLTETKTKESRWFKIPFLYRDGLELTQGKAE